MNAPDPDSDPSMENQPAGDATPAMNPFLPITLLGLGFAICLIAIVSNASEQKTGIQQAVERNQPVLQQAAQVKNATTKLITDVVDLAKDGDDNAKYILYRAKITGTDGQPLVSVVQPPAGGSGPASTTPAPSPTSSGS